MKKLTLAVISDIHVGDGARAKDLCPTSSTKRNELLDDDYIKKFLTFISKNKLTADYLVLPGDVTHRAQPEEVQLASDFITTAAKALNVPADKIVFVPGNHDVDWAVMKLGDTEFRRKQRYDPIQRHDCSFKKITTNGSGNLFEEPHFTKWSFNDLFVLGYNSSHHDDPSKFHHGLVDPAHINEMRALLKTVPKALDQMRLFLIHHHPIQYSDPTPHSPDHSLMINAEQLQELLREFNFDILVHGHKHLPRFTTQSLNGMADIAILCSGSFSVQIDTRWTGKINNQFHMIVVESRDEQEQLIQGHVASWAYTYNSGWEPSDEHYGGIPHIEPFGTYIRPNKVLGLLRPIVAEHLKASDYIEWNWIAAKFPGLKHLRPSVVRSAMDSLALEFNCWRHGDTPEKTILLKNK